MANESLLEALTEEDPCGPDLRWDPEFMAADQVLESLSLEGDEGVVQGEVVGGDSQVKTLDAKVESLCSRTRDIRIMAIRAELAWYRGGLVEFADAMEDLVALAQRWPDVSTGFHPRVNEDEYDLEDRAAAVGKLMKNTMRLAATLGWGSEQPPPDVRRQTATILSAVFDNWSESLEPAFGTEIPLCVNAWNAIKKVLGNALSSPVETVDSEGVTVETSLSESMDAWDLIEQAVEAMSQQDRHSPALPILQVLLKWRSTDILEIVEAQRKSGVTLEQLLDSARNQLFPPAS